jgi:hypothetical protein
MSGHVLLLMYGLCAWGAGLNLPAWIRLAVRAWRNPDRRRPWWQDTHMLVRIGIMFLAFGTSGLAGLRTIASLTGRVPLEVPSKAGLLFIAAMALAEPFFLRVDEVHARARHAFPGVAALLDRTGGLVRRDRHGLDGQLT